MSRVVCRADDATVSCAERRHHVVRGRFRHVWGHGHIWLDSKHPDWTWDRCPWCGEQLPDLHEATYAYLAKVAASGWDWSDRDATDGEGAE